MNYEEAINELEKIEKELANGDVKIDEAVKLFEKSVELSKLCFENLKQTEGKITMLKKELDKMVEVPLG
ncbi:MAG: exodeoxyribonuclease VII small subunit [Clostridia bacterium]|nr:exodeoxyribonuclease VII small subunit [Clostridia bacterium]